MRVYANTRQKVNVDPQDVISKLIEKEIGTNGWVFSENEKYYRGYERCMGTHSSDDQVEILKERYDYVVALQLVLQYLKKENS